MHMGHRRILRRYNLCMLPTLAPLLPYVMPWRKNKSPSSPGTVNGVITIGGSGANKGSKHSRFERLDESVLRDEDLRSDHGTDGRRWGDAESQGSGDEIPLKGIQTGIRNQNSRGEKPKDFEARKPGQEDGSTTTPPHVNSRGLLVQ
jgi:hypothetical protein